jgi:hypothetical protein
MTLPVMIDSALPEYKDPKQFRESVVALQEQLAELPQVDCPLTHRFTEGAYAREIFLPANTLIIGKIHKHGHLNFITKGEVSVVTEFGTERYTAPYTFVSLPLTKRALYTHSDTIWTTVHVTTETDLIKLEEELIYPSYDEAERIEQAKQALGLQEADNGILIQQDI